MLTNVLAICYSSLCYYILSTSTTMLIIFQKNLHPLYIRFSSHKPTFDFQYIINQPSYDQLLIISLICLFEFSILYLDLFHSKQFIHHIIYILCCFCLLFPNFVCFTLPFSSLFIKESSSSMAVLPTSSSSLELTISVPGFASSPITFLTTSSSSGKHHTEYKFHYYLFVKIFIILSSFLLGQ